MISELYIKNFAIIEELRLQLAPGFNVLTGETGAGKSIILDAVMLLLGGRADTDVVRSGCETAYVEGVFTLPPPFREAIAPLLAEEGVEGDDPESLLLAREVRLNGRNIGRVNGRAVTVTFMRQVSEGLVDIHGQGEHLSLLRPRAHLPLLDAYGGLQEERHVLAKEVRELGKIRKELTELRQNARNIAQRIDMLQYQVEEIDAARLEVGEEERVRAERTRLANVEQLLEHSSEAVALIMEVDGEMPAAVDLLGQAERALGHLARLDETCTPSLRRLEGLVSELSDLAVELRDYQEALEYDPDRLNFLEERLNLISNLKRKYGDDVEEILRFREKAAAELEAIGHNEERTEELEAEVEVYLRRIGQMAQALSQKRRAVADRLAGAVEQELADLNMEGARFTVAFERTPDEEGAQVNGERLAFDHTGIDQVQFLISTNPGEPLKPMAKVASGGETSRLMLALKTALARVDETPTLIFDEIDQGIGGRVGDVVGRKLWALTGERDHQVIVVTHLPQLAGYGDAHYHVSKFVRDGRTVTGVERVEGDGRIDELAAMLGTQGEAARRGAQAIRSQAAAVKEGDGKVTKESVDG